MKHANIFAMLVLVSLIAAIPFVPSAFAQGEKGPYMDTLRHYVIQSPDAALLRFRADQVDISPDLIRTNDVETMSGDGDLITQDLGFHMGFIGYNIRDTATIRSYWRTDVNYWPLADAQFRHALIHAYDQLGIIPSIYGYTVTPVRSLVPPAESKYYYAASKAHPYNPGNPLASTVYNPANGANEDSSSILRYALYTFHDAGTIGTVDDADYWVMPNGDPLPRLRIYTPLIDVAPTSFQHGLEFISDLTAIGLGATTANGNKGFEHAPADFSTYLNDVFGTPTTPGGKFDAFMVFWSLGRIPDHLYDMLHSSQDSRTGPPYGRQNAVGINDATMDALAEQVKFSLDTEQIRLAARDIQIKMYEPELPNADKYALAYMLLYSRSYFNGFRKELQGVIKSPGYGSDNTFTYLTMQWKAGYARVESGRDTVIYVNGDYPESFNPLFASTVYAWNPIGATQDGLLNVNPYNHFDIPWLATSWSNVKTTTGSTITYTLRTDVDWQDGNPFTAADVAWCLKFIRDRHVPRYAATWLTLVDAQAVGNTVTVTANEAGVSLLYDYAGLGPLLPPQVWDRAWADDAAVLGYDPTEAYNVAPGYLPGPTPTPTNLFGTGPWIFQFYSAAGGYDDMWANRNYFMSQADVVTLMANMFWQVGDTDKSGVVDGTDFGAIGYYFGTVPVPASVNCDINSDVFIDTLDLSEAGYHLDWLREYKAALP